MFDHCTYIIRSSTLMTHYSKITALQLKVFQLLKNASFPFQSRVFKFKNTFCVNGPYAPHLASLPIRSSIVLSHLFIKSIHICLLLLVHNCINGHLCIEFLFFSPLVGFCYVPAVYVFGCLMLFVYTPPSLRYLSVSNQQRRLVFRLVLCSSSPVYTSTVASTNGLVAMPLTSHMLVSRLV